MLEHTKKHPTPNERVELKFVGPLRNREKAIELLQDLNFTAVTDNAGSDDAVPWEDAFPEFEKSELPGIVLAGARHKEGLTQKQLSELSGIPQGHISDMENGKRNIGIKTAKRLAEVLDIGYKVFL